MMDRLTATADPPDGWRPDWEALAEQIVGRTLDIQDGERVVYLADPGAQPGLFEAVRGRVLRAGGIEHATILNWTGPLRDLRDVSGREPAPERRMREDRSRLELLAGADVFMWLPNDWARQGKTAAGQSEWVLGRWRGRGLHFHWFDDFASPPGAPVHRRLHHAYERAILDLDYQAHQALQGRVLEAIRGRHLRVTTPDGTDVELDLTKDGWYHRNDGLGTREKAGRGVSARDREEELPCGALRTLPVAGSARGIIRYRQGQGVYGHGIDLAAHTRDLDLVIRDGGVSELRSGVDDAALQRGWAAQTGDRGAVSEIVFGTNPLLPLAIEGARFPPYFGFGAGSFRFHLGDITESGGPQVSSFSAELWLTDATITADGETLVRDGTLLVR